MKIKYIITNLNDKKIFDKNINQIKKRKWILKEIKKIQKTY